jgi:Kef-type K+ transport system membrane component KefB
MTWIVRPLLARYSFLKQETSVETLAFTLLFLFLSAWTTERIGIRALFGAFFAGVLLPRSENFSRSLTSELGAITTIHLHEHALPDRTGDRQGGT